MRAGPPSPLVAIADLDTLGEALPGLVKDAWLGGVPWMILRAKGADTAWRVRLAREILDRAPGIFLSLHGDLRAAAMAGCPGVHLPFAGVGDLREALSSFSCVGVSCHGAGELEKAAGADYAFLSPVFAPTSKPGDERPPLDWARFDELAKESPVPVYALGGLRLESAADASRAGAAGVAVLGGLFLSPDVRGCAERWVEAVGLAFGKVGGS